jgi:hypothetical protein
MVALRDFIDQMKMESGDDEIACPVCRAKIDQNIETIATCVPLQDMCNKYHKEDEQGNYRPAMDQDPNTSLRDIVDLMSTQATKNTIERFKVEFRGAINQLVNDPMYARQFSEKTFNVICTDDRWKKVYKTLKAVENHGRNLIAKAMNLDIRLNTGLRANSFLIKFM